jgi:hypothetical protein
MRLPDKSTLKRKNFMSDIFEDMFDEADAVSRVDTGTGKQLSQLVRNLRTVEQDIEDAETHLKTLKQLLKTSSLLQYLVVFSWVLELV